MQPEVLELAQLSCVLTSLHPAYVKQLEYALPLLEYWLRSSVTRFYIPTVEARGKCSKDVLK